MQQHYLVGVKKQGISGIRSYTSLDYFTYYTQYCFIIKESMNQFINAKNYINVRHLLLYQINPSRDLNKIG